jgi:hypothetical protein
VTAADVNLVLPAAMVALAAWYPRFWTALAGAVLAMAGFALAHMLQREWHFWLWTWSSLGLSTLPIMIAATVGYALIGSVVAALTRTVRRVGLEDPGPRCAACGYSLVGLGGAVCPECGAPGDAGRSRYI